MPNETPKRYVQVFINGDEKNLPQKVGRYISSLKNYAVLEVYFDPDVADDWMEDIDWYLQPETEGKKSKEDESELKLLILDLLNLNKSTRIDEVRFYSEDTVCNIIRQVVNCRVRPSQIEPVVKENLTTQEPAQRTADLRETDLYKKFISALEIHDMRANANPFVVKCCAIAEEYRNSALPTEAKKIMQTTDEYYAKQ